MPQDKIVGELSEEEKKLKLYWADIIKHLKTDNGKIDFAYIWTDEVKRDFEGIKTEAGKIAFFLKKLHSDYKTNEQKYYKEISHIKILLSNIKKIKANAGWVKEIRMDLEDVIRDVEREKTDVASIDKELISRKYLSYEVLMNLIRKHGYIYHSSNIKPGQVPRIILFGESHTESQGNYKFLEEFFELVDKGGKKLVVLYEGKGSGIRNFKYGEGLLISQKALYYGIDTKGSLEGFLLISLASFKSDLLYAFVNEVDELLIKFWKRPSSAGYYFLKSFNIDPIKIDSVSNLKEKFYQRIEVLSKKIVKEVEKRDQAMMTNTLKYLKRFPEYLFFLIVGGSHIDTYRPSMFTEEDRIKEEDRFSIFFNQNGVSYFSILQKDFSKGVNPKMFRFKDFVTTEDSSGVYGTTFSRKFFCSFYKLDENLFFRLADETRVMNLIERVKRDRL